MRYSLDQRFGFFCCKYSSYLARHERIDFYRPANRKWREKLSYTLYILFTDTFEEDRWDKTLKELHEMGIGDFNELIDYEGEPAESDTGTEKYHDIMDFEAAHLGCIEWQEMVDLAIARHRPITPIELEDGEDDEEELEEPKEAWAELIDEEEPEEPEGSWVDLFDHQWRAS